MSAPAEPAPKEPSGRQTPHGMILFRAPPAPIALGLIVLLSAALAAVLWAPQLRTFEWGFLLSIVGPALVTGVLTTPIARATGGRFEWHRSLFLVITVLVLQLPLAAAWRGALYLWPASVPQYCSWARSSPVPRSGSGT